LERLKKRAMKKLFKQKNSGDRLIILTDRTWKDYEEAIALREDNPTPRISYLDGVLTFMSPGKNHERTAETIAALITAYCDYKQIDYYPWRSTTLKQEDNSAGKEPDASYCFGEDKDKPDLAIEVIYSSGGLDDLQKYKRLGIPEVWFWQNNKLKVYLLNREDYLSVVNFSEILPELNLKLFEEYVNKALSGNLRIVKKEFIDTYKNHTHF
jgi:Uma2 family endonuclease